MFSLDATGQMTVMGFETDGGAIVTPRGIAMDLGGRFRLVANQQGRRRRGGILWFQVDATTGQLPKMGGLTAVASPYFMGIVHLPG